MTTIEDLPNRLKRTPEQQALVDKLGRSPEKIQKNREINKKYYYEVEKEKRKDPVKKKELAEARKRRKAKEAETTKKRRRDPLQWPKVVLVGIRHRCKAKGIEFNIEPEDIPVSELCPVFGTPLKFTEDSERSSKWSKGNEHPSVDRIDNTKGYIKGNVRVISTRANALKKDATLEELKALVRYVERELGGVC